MSDTTRDPDCRRVTAGDATPPAERIFTTTDEDDPAAGHCEHTGGLRPAKDRFC